MGTQAPSGGTSSGDGRGLRGDDRSSRCGCRRSGERAAEEVGQAVAGRLASSRGPPSDQLMSSWYVRRRHGRPRPRRVPARPQGPRLRGLPRGPCLRAPLGADAQRRRQLAVRDRRAALPPPLFQRGVCARARPPRRGGRSAARAVHGDRPLGGGPPRGGRPVPRRRGRRVPPPGLSGRHGHRPERGRREARVGESPRVRRRHLGDAGSKSARGGRRQLPADEPGRQAAGVMGLLTGIVERVPAAYYSDERQAILESARAFAMNEVLPVANRLDPVQGEIPMELRRKMAELGYFGVLIPQEYGGLGLGIFEYVLITEELARAWMSVASIIARGNGIGAGFSEEKRRQILPRMARGECLGAFALSEPGAGSDVASIRCRAELVGDAWVVNGP